MGSRERLEIVSKKVICPSCRSSHDVVVVDDGEGRKAVCDRCLYEWRIK